MKLKITTLLVFLTCSISSMLAQRVASNPTDLASLSDGYYMIVAKSGKTNEAGNFVYTDGSKVRIDNKSKSLDKLGQVFSTTDNDKYIWKITRSDNSMNIQSYSNNKYWNRYSHAGTVWDKESIVDRDQIETGSSSHTYTIETSGDYARLTIDNKYGTFASNSKTVYVTDCSDAKSSDDGNLGYRRTPGTDVVDMTFYAVEVPEQVSITYNYVENGSTIATKQMTTSTFRPFPSLNIPDFVTTTTTLGDLVYSEDNGKTFDIECTTQLPFTTGTLYYLQGDISTNSRMTINGSLGTHAATEQPALNDIANDLWRVEGNAIEGFKFYNITTGKYLTYNASSLFTSASVSMTDAGSNWKVRNNSSQWDASQITDGMTKGFALTTIENAELSSSNFVTVGSTVGLGAANNAATLMLVEPTLKLALNYSAADDARFATTCLPYAVEVADEASTVKTYAGQLINNNTELDMAEVSAVPANQGVIIKGNAADESVTLRVIASAADIANDLKGTTSELTDLTGVLSFGRANGTGNVGFFRSTNATLKANRAYVKLDGENQASLAMRFDGNTTSIDQINGAATIDNNAPIYDLTGRQVSHLIKGTLYIQGGRKFIAQ